MTQYILTLRDEAPLDEIQSALRNLAASYPYGLTVNSRGEILLWSDNAWNVGNLKEEK